MVILQTLWRGHHRAFLMGMGAHALACADVRLRAQGHRPGLLSPVLPATRWRAAT